MEGKPVYLVEAVKEKDRLKEFCSLERFKDSEAVKCDEITNEVVWCVKNNVLFLDPRKRLLKPQFRIDLLAIRRVLEEIG